MSNEDLEYSLSNNVNMIIGELQTIEKIGMLANNIRDSSFSFQGLSGDYEVSKNIAIRINPGIGAGECEKTITGGKNSKFGIYISQLDEINRICDQYGLTITGVHIHIGSNL